MERNGISINGFYNPRKIIQVRWSRRWRPRLLIGLISLGTIRCRITHWHRGHPCLRMRLGCWKSSYIITSRGSLRSRWPLRVRCECQRLRAFCCCSPFYFPARFVASDWDSMWWAPTTWRFLPRLYPLHTRFLQSEKRLKCPRHSVSLIPRTWRQRCEAKAHSRWKREEALVSLCCPGAGQVYVTKAGRNQSELNPKASDVTSG